MIRILGRTATRLGVLVAIILLTVVGTEAHAQNIISVPFTTGFIGNRGSSAGSSNSVLTYATLGIARTFFIQNSSTNTFELQGNDLPGTLRIVRTNGTTVDMPASVNWRNSGGATYLMGILPRPASPITWTYAGGSIQITDGSNPGGSSIGGYVAAYSGTPAADGASISGNAAQSQVLSGLNSYLSTVVSSRPAGPVTVSTLSTTSSTPTLTGTVTLAAGEALSVVVNGVQYTTSTSPALSVSGGNWSLALTNALSVGTYEVTATITNADGFTLSDATSNELTVAASLTSLTIGGSFTANNKVYDRTTTATGSTGSLTLVGVQNGHTVTIASVTLAFQSNGVANGKTVVISAITLGGANAGSYTVNLAGSPTATANITAKALTLGGSFTASNKVYDRATSATVATNSLSLTGVISPDAVSINTTTAAFATATVANGKTVSLSAVTLTGANAANYSVSLAGAPTTTANITKKSLSIGGSFTANDKNFDGNTSAVIANDNLTLTGVVAPDAVSLTGVTAAFATASVGAGKTVSVATATLAGGDAGNYSLTLAGAPTTTAAITAVGNTLTIAGAFTADNKVYDRAVAATGTTTGLTLTGITPGDQVTIASVTLEFQTSSVGSTKTVEITGVTLGGADAAGYSVDLTGAPTASADITVASLTLGGSFTASNKQYDRTTTATIATNTLTLTGLLSPDDVSINSVTAAFGTASVANGKTVSVTAASISGSDAANYTLSIAGAPTTTANITAKSLTLGGSFTANNKNFDGNTTASIAGNSLSLTGVIAPDDVTLGTVTTAFATAAVGNGKAVSISAATLSGGDAGNYTLSLVGAPTSTGNILAVGGVLTVGGTLTANNKVYDRTTAATGSTTGLTLVGVSNGHTVTIASAVLAFDDASAASGKTVRITSLTLDGADAGLYSLNLAASPTATAGITPKPVRIVGSFTASDKRYDNTATATIVSNTLTLTGVIAPDVVALANVGAIFDTPAIGTGKTVSLSGTTLSGAASSNYQLLTSDAPTTTASITSNSPPGAPIDVRATAGDRQLSVTWQRPLDEGCSDIGGYVVSWSIDGSNWITREVTGRLTTSFVITPLVNNQPVQVRVAARNECGLGPNTATTSPVTPIGATTEGGTPPPTVPTGRGTTTSPNGGTITVTTTVVQDTTLQLTAGPVSLSLRSRDVDGKPVPVDSGNTLLLDRGGQAATDGTGFKPATIVTLYIYPKNGTPLLLGTFTVSSSGSFNGFGTIPATLAAGDYTLQVVGIDISGAPRSAALGVSITEPPPELEFAVTPSTTTPAVGDTIQLSLTVTNVGKSAALNVSIPRAFNEPGFRVVATTPLEGRYDAATGTWTIDRIEVNAVARLRFTVIVLPPASTEGLR